MKIIKDDIFSEILKDRGIHDGYDMHKHLNPQYEYIDSTYGSLSDIDKCIARIEKAILDKEPICVYGDFDVDGLTSTAILVKAIKLKGGNAFPYIPNRITQGHSLHRNSIQSIAKRATLIITVDCGITVSYTHLTLPTTPYV